MAPRPCLTVVTLGVTDMKASIRFYEALGFARRAKATGEQVAFFDAGSAVLALYPWDKLAEDATLWDKPRPQAFRGMTLAWNRSTPAEVDEAMAHALSAGAQLLKQPHEDVLRRLFGLFHRSGRPSLGGRLRAGCRRAARRPRAAG